MSDLAVEDFQELANQISDSLELGDFKNEQIKITLKLFKFADWALWTADMYINYSEDPDGTKHVIAEFAGKVVGDFVFLTGAQYAIRLAVAAGMTAAIADGPSPGLDAVGLYLAAKIAGVGIILSKVLSENVEKWTKVGVEALYDALKTFFGEDNNVIISEDGKTITIYNADGTLTSITRSEDGKTITTDRFDKNETHLSRSVITQDSAGITGVFSAWQKTHDFQKLLPPQTSLMCEVFFSGS